MNNISVVIPIYNLSKKSDYFKKLILSLADALQLCPNDFLAEIVVVNDQPSEDPYDFVEAVFSELGLVDKLVYLTNLKNIGQALSRNVGAKSVNGDYIHFIDQDDYISKTFYKVALNDNSDVIMHNVIFDDGKQRGIFHNNIFCFFMKKVSKICQCKPLLFSNIFISPGQYFIKREFFFKLNGFPVLDNYGADDYGLAFNMTKDCSATLSFYNDSFFYYRYYLEQSRNSSNMTQSIYDFFELSSCTGFLYIVKYVRCHRFLNAIFNKIHSALFNKRFKGLPEY